MTKTMPNPSRPIANPLSTDPPPSEPIGNCPNDITRPRTDLDSRIPDPSQIQTRPQRIVSRPAAIAKLIHRIYEMPACPRPPHFQTLETIKPAPPPPTWPQEVTPWRTAITTRNHQRRGLTQKAPLLRTPTTLISPSWKLLRKSQQLTRVKTDPKFASKNWKKDNPTWSPAWQKFTCTNPN